MLALCCLPLSLLCCKVRLCEFGERESGKCLVRKMWKPSVRAATLTREQSILHNISIFFITARFTSNFNYFLLSADEMGTFATCNISWEQFKLFLLCGRTARGKIRHFNDWRGGWRIFRKNINSTLSLTNFSAIRCVVCAPTQHTRNVKRETR